MNEQLRTDLASACAELRVTKVFAHIWLLILALTISGCSRTTDPGDGKAKGASGQIKWVDPKSIQPGPIRHDTLTAEQLARIRALHGTFAEAFSQPLEKWIDNFKRDADPDRELRVWERMASAYRGFCDKRTLSKAAKREVFQVVLLRSTAPEPEVLKELKLKELSKDDALEIMRGF